MSPRDGPRLRGGAAPHDTAPAAVLAAIRDFDGPLLLDLDEILYLRDSTADFLAGAGVAAAVLLAVLEWIQPWRWTGGAASRDAWRVRAVTLLLPWTPARWRRRAAQRVEELGNGPLIAVLRAHASRPVLLTRGFDTIAAPLVAALALGEAGVVATRPARFDDRQRGPLARVVDALGEDTVRRALVLTGPAGDPALLGACARPLRTTWPQPAARPATAASYLPGRELTRLKGESYIARRILQEDFAFWLLASIGLAASPVLHTLGLLLLLLSFWSICERGYVDRERAAARDGAPAPVPAPEPWAWALGSGVLAILLLRGPAHVTLIDLVTWPGVLLATRGLFLLHDRAGAPARVWLHAGLQFARGAACLALVPVAPVGAAALGAHILARWLAPFADRGGPAAQPRLPQPPMARLLLFCVLASLLALSQGAAALLNGTAAALLGWMLLQARHDLGAALARVRRVDRPRDEAPG